MKTINFELSKRLNDLWLLDNMETEYWYEYDNETKNCDINYFLPFNKNIICKTLTLDESIEFIKNYNNTLIDFRLCINYWEYYIISNCKHYYFRWKTFIEAIEKMIEFLLDNNLLTK